MSLSAACPADVPVMSAMATRSRWTKPRLFRAAVLFGRGLDAAEIARDEFVQSHPELVRKVCRYYGAAFGERPPGNLMIDVPHDLLASLEAYARRRRQTPEALASAVLRILAADTTLLANVLDDEA